MLTQLKVAPIFSNDMVLQRDKNIIVWGTGQKDSIITVSLSEITKQTMVKEGKWSLELPKLPAGGPYDMVVRDDKDTIVFANVMMGEVWLAGGQSNMELELQNSENGKEVVAKANTKGVRFYNTLRLSYIDEDYYKKEETNTWQTCTPETCGTWSAVGYYYAKRVSEQLGVTVGIIGCNWGGTSASAWISRDELALDKDTNTYNEEYDAINATKSFEEYCIELEEYNTWYVDWQGKVNQLYSDNPNILWSQVQEIAGECRWPEPLGPKSPFRAGGLYETMLKRVIPYTLSGFIYYQGESDDHKPNIYAKLLTKLILQWRSDWKDENLPFMIVQLPMYVGKEDEDKKNWPIIRQQQMLVHKTIKNTGIAVILECGEFDNIHPLDKAVVGERLALQAFYHVYNKKILAYGPIYKERNLLGDKIELLFDYAESGLVMKSEKETGFEIAGEDKVYLKADAKVVESTIILSAKTIKEPLFARYAWTNFGPVTVFNKEGLPLSTFSI